MMDTNITKGNKQWDSVVGCKESYKINDFLLIWNSALALSLPSLWSWFDAFYLSIVSISCYTQIFILISSMSQQISVIPIQLNQT